MYPVKIMYIISIHFNGGSSMKTSSFLALSLAAFLLLSCSSDDEPKLVNCQTGFTCVSNLTADQCTATAGEVVQSCQGSNAKVNCQIPGALCYDIYTSSQCNAMGGEVVDTCDGDDDPSGFCLVNGNCSPGVKLSTCSDNGGRFDRSKCPTTTGGAWGSCLKGEYCYDNYQAAQCAVESGQYTTELCPKGSCRNSVSCVDNKTKSECGQGTWSLGTCSGGTSSGSVGTSSSSGGTSIPTPTGYCDFGYPTTSGGGCFPLYPGDNCDSEYGKVVQKCGRTDVKYCQYPAYGATLANCHATASCSGGTAAFVTECPTDLYGKTFYCFYYDDEYDELACDEIGVYWASARACLTAGDNAGVAVAIVDRAFCVDAGAEIY
jgi:hypothetical protein